MKSPTHGFPRSRPPKRGIRRGIHPTRTGAAPSGPVQKRDYETHRLVKVEATIVTDRGPRRSRAAKGGAGEKPAGKRLASDIRHRVDTAKEATDLPPHVGGKERVAELCLNE